MTNNPYQTFKKDELAKSKILAGKLTVPEHDFIKIQNWFDLLLLKHRELSSNREEQLDAEKDLELKFYELLSSEIERKSYKYILPKLLYYNNEFHGAFLRSLYVARIGALLADNLISRLVNDRIIVYSAEDFLHVTDYLRDHYFVSPNSNLLEDTLKIESVRSILKHAPIEIKSETLKNILHIIYQKTFHHDIVCFKKILKLISPADRELIDYLKEFQVENGQGCYSIIHEILNLNLLQDDWEDFELKFQLINFLDSGRGSKPSSSWSKKFQDLSVIIDKRKFLEITDSILKNENCKTYEFDYGAVWSDDVVKRFLKSAGWINQSI